MHKNSLVVAHPAASTQLVLLFHGVGSSAQDLLPLGEAIAQEHPHSTIVSVQAPLPSQLGRGWEWFSVVGITEHNRPERIAQAMSVFVDTVAHWQSWSGIGPDRTVLLGFSQGAIMSLESTQTSTPLLPAARTVIAMAGRFAEPIRHAPAGVSFHLIHGDSDGVVAPQWSIQAEQQLRALGGSVTLDVVPGLGHGIDGRVLQCVIHYLNLALNTAPQVFK